MLPFFFLKLIETSIIIDNYICQNNNKRPGPVQNKIFAPLKKKKRLLSKNRQKYKNNIKKVVGCFFFFFNIIFFTPGYLVKK